MESMRSFCPVKASTDHHVLMRTKGQGFSGRGAVKFELAGLFVPAVLAHLVRIVRRA
jgi:hypothetical protein